MESDDGILLSAEELDKVPSNTVGALKTRGDNLKIKYLAKEYESIMELSTNGETRRKVFTGLVNRFKNNKPILKDIIGLRLKFATIFGSHWGTPPRTV